MNPRLPELAVLFPVRAWLRHPALRSWTTWLFVALVAVPPATLRLFQDARGVLGESILFATYFAAAWFLVLWVVVRPQRLRAAMVAQIAAIEVVLVLAFLFAVDIAPADLDDLLSSTLLVGVPEELVKALPAVALALAYRRLSLPPREILFLAATSGLVFGAIEAVVYAVAGDHSSSYDALRMVWRFATDPVAHALWAGLSGYFIGLAVHYRTPGPFLALTGIGVGVPAVLHGINDWAPVNTSLAWVGVAVVSALLFLAYAHIGLVAAAPAPGRRDAPLDPPTAPVHLHREALFTDS